MGDFSPVTERAADSRQRLRPWLITMLDDNKCEGMYWMNRSEGKFRIPWQHGSKQGWSAEKYGKVFKEWAIHTGRFRENVDKEEWATWKTRLRCAFNKAKNIIEEKDMSNRQASDPFRVYRLNPPPDNKTTEGSVYYEDPGLACGLDSQVPKRDCGIPTFVQDQKDSLKASSMGSSIRSDINLDDAPMSFGSLDLGVGGAKPLTSIEENSLVRQIEEDQLLGSLNLLSLDDDMKQQLVPMPNMSNTTGAMGRTNIPYLVADEITDENMPSDLKNLESGDLLKANMPSTGALPSMASMGTMDVDSIGKYIENGSGQQQNQGANVFENTTIFPVSQAVPYSQYNPLPAFNTVYQTSTTDQQMFAQGQNLTASGSSTHSQLAAVPPDIILDSSRQDDGDLINVSDMSISGGQVMLTPTSLMEGTAAFNHQCPNNGKEFWLEVLYNGKAVVSQHSIVGSCKVFYDPVNRAAAKGYHGDCISLPDVRSSFEQGLINVVSTVTVPLSSGFEIDCIDGDVFVKRHCKVSLFYSTQIHPESNKIGRPQREKVYSYEQLSLFSQTSRDGSPNAPDPTVYIFCGQTNYNYQNAEKALIVIKVIPCKALNVLKLAKQMDPQSYLH